MKQSAVRIGIFVVLITIVLGLSSAVLRENIDETRRLKSFYGLDNNTVDLLVLGSSHAHCTFYTNVFWRQLGISSFVLGGAKQTMWDSYYMLLEALKTQKPGLVILESFAISFPNQYESFVFSYRNLSGLRWTDNKLQAIHTASPEGESAGFFLDYIPFHERYRFLSRTDFRFSEKNPDYKGTSFLEAQEPHDSPVIPDGASPRPVNPKQEEYYRRIITLTQEQGIPLLVVAAPFFHDDAQYEMLMTAEEIAGEYGIPFLNGNDLYRDAGIDYATHTADGTHLNYLGGPAFTKYITDYIASHYSLPDHRGDPAFETWRRDAEYLERDIYNCIFRDAADLQTLLSSFAMPTYAMIVSFSGDCRDTDEGLQPLLQAMGLEPLGEGGIRLVSAKRLIRTCLPGEEQCFVVEDAEFYFESAFESDGTRVENTVLCDGEPLPKAPEENGMTVTIYDLEMGKAVASAVTWTANGYSGFQWTK